MSLAPTRARMRHGWLGSTVLGCALVLGGQNADAVHLHPSSVQVQKRAKRLSRFNQVQLVEELGSGNNQHAFLVRTQQGGTRVLKMFQHRDAATSDPKALEILANVVESSARALREDPAFVARFGEIIPKSEVAGQGATLQDFVRDGVPITQLSGDAATHARAEAQAAISLARARLGTLPVSGNLENFRFEPLTGRIVGWFDHLSHSDLDAHLRGAREQGLDRSPARSDPSRLSAPALPSRLNTRNRGRASRWYAAIEAMLENAEVEVDAANPTTSANATRIVTLRTLDGRRLRGVWKPVDGESATIEAYPADSPFAGTRPYPLKTLFLNEIRAARLANALGLQFLVGPTVERTIGGQRGSLQLLVEDAQSATEHPAGATLRREEAELLRVFDYLIGNADRIARNLLVRKRRGQYLPVGIDHGLTFPVGTTLGLATRPFATDWIEGQVGPLLDSTRELIKGIPAETVARVLMKTGADPRQAAHALRRLERLKRDPSFLEVKAPGAAGMEDMLARVRSAAEERSQGLESETLDELNKIVEAAQR